MRKFSSAGRASALQAEGHRFEPYNFHQYGPVVQLVRTLACHARGRGFEPHPGRHCLSDELGQYASVAQLVEQRTENPRVVGSIPTGGTSGIDRYADLAHLVERDLAKVEVAGSSPVIRSILFKQRMALIRRHSQAVRQRSAKPLFPGPIPGGASIYVVRKDYYTQKSLIFKDFSCF